MDVIDTVRSQTDDKSDKTQLNNISNVLKKILIVNQI
jgi:hypothetical protein